MRRWDISEVVNDQLPLERDSFGIEIVPGS